MLNSELSRNCVDLFQEAARRDAVDEESQEVKDKLADLYYKFLLWSGNVGALAQGSASIDKRFQSPEDKDIADTLRFTLELLEESLDELVNPPDDDDGGDSESDSGLSTDSDGSWGSLERRNRLGHCDGGGTDNRLTSSGPPGIKGTTAENETASSLASVNTMIGRLFKLASVIRKPVSTTEDARIKAFLRRRADDRTIQEELNYHELSTHARFKITYRYDKDPEFSVPKKLVDRLVEAILYRRAKLVYRDHHQAKLRDEGCITDQTPQVLSNPQDAQQQLPSNDATPITIQKKVKWDSSLEESNLAVDSGANLDQRIGKGAVSETNPSSINREKYPDFAKSVAASSINRSTIQRQGELDVPEPPRLGDDNDSHVECPYCHKFLTKELLGRARWTRHILQDIEPYVCLFPDCETPHLLYRKPEDWLSHMQEHAVVWCCEVAGHESEIFNSKQDLEGHIRDCHSGTFTESQLPFLIERGKRTVEDPFFHLASQLDPSSPLNQRSFQPQGAHRCFLCPEFGKKERSFLVAGSDLYHHFIQHLESLALLSLQERHIAEQNEDSCVQENQDTDGGNIRRGPVSSQDLDFNLDNDSFESFGFGDYREVVEHRRDMIDLEWEYLQPDKRENWEFLNGGSEYQYLHTLGQPKSSLSVDNTSEKSTSLAGPAALGTIIEIPASHETNQFTFRFTSPLSPRRLPGQTVSLRHSHQSNDPSYNSSQKMIRKRALERPFSFTQTSLQNQTKSQNGEKNLEKSIT